MVGLRGILSAIIVTAILLTTAFYLFTTYYLENGSSIVRLRNDYESVYAQIISGGGKVCSAGEVGFATYVKWDAVKKEFVKMCVYPTGNEVSVANPVNNKVIVIPAG